MGAAEPPRAATELAVGEQDGAGGNAYWCAECWYITGVGMHANRCREGAYFG